MICRGKRCHKYSGKKSKSRHHRYKEKKAEKESAARGAVYFHHLAGGDKTDYRKYQYDINT